MAREKFDFGARSKKFPNQNEKKVARFFQETHS
nr:hypothetical protein [Porphyromonas gulae]